MRPGEGVNLYGSSALMRHSIAWPRSCDVALRERQLLAGGDADLHLHDVDAGHQFGHRVLDLHARVHLDEEELAVLVQELEGAGAAVADLLAGGDAALADLLDHAARDARRRRLLDDLLVAALHRAVALAEPDARSCAGRPGPGSRCGAGSRGTSPCRRPGCRTPRRPRRASSAPRATQRRLGVHDAHAAPAAAARGLDDHRVADGARRADRSPSGRRAGRLRSRARTARRT